MFDILKKTGIRSAFWTLARRYYATHYCLSERALNENDVLYRWIVVWLSILTLLSELVIIIRDWTLKKHDAACIKKCNSCLKMTHYSHIIKATNGYLLKIHTDLSCNVTQCIISRWSCKWNDGLINVYERESSIMGHYWYCVHISVLHWDASHI